MYALSIEFSDFVSVKNEKITSSKLSKTCLMVSDFPTNNSRYMDSDNLPAKEQAVLGSGSKKDPSYEVS